MPRHCPAEAYAYLEERKPGLYHELVSYAISNNGIVHSAPDCFCCAAPAPDNPQHVIIYFQCSELPALWRLATMYAHRFTHVRFRRDFKNGYAERTIPMPAFLRKTSLVCTLARHA